MNKGYISASLIFTAGVLLIATVFSSELYVDGENPKASDNNVGTEQSPFKTISIAASRVKPGDTVYVKKGTYREYVKLPAGREDAPITLTSWKNDVPVIKGSDILKGPWNPVNASVKYKGTEPVAIFSCPLEAYTQMVFVDESPLKQIGFFEHMGPKDWHTPLIKYDGTGVEDMRPGTFFYDKDRKILYVWLSDSSNPSQHTIEYALRLCGILISDYCYLKGFEVRHCQALPGKEHMGIGGTGKKLVVESCKATYNDFAGMLIQGEDCIIRNNEMAYNGNCGFISSVGKRMLMEGNTTHHNNTRKYAAGWCSGGMKIVQWKDSKVIRQHAYKEHGALWFDINCLDMLIADCLLEDSGTGIYFEISRWGIIVNNVVRNCGRGIWSYSSDVLIANNVTDGCPEGITISGELRGGVYSTGYPEPARNCLPATRNNLVVNNIIIDSTGSYIAANKDSVHCGSNYSDYNVFVWTMPKVHWGTNHIKFMAGWDDYYGRLQFWQNQRHYDGHSTIADPQLFRIFKEGLLWDGAISDEKYLVADPLFVSRENGDYRLMPDSPLMNKGREVPQLLNSVYYPGKRPWAKTLISDAPDPATAKVEYEIWGDKNYRYQPEPEPLMMFDSDKQKPALPGINSGWRKNGNYPEFAIAKDEEKQAGTGRQFTRVVNENLIQDPEFVRQDQNGTTKLPWVNSAGRFHPWDKIACANLTDYAKRGVGYQEVGTLKPNTKYTLTGDMLVKTFIKDVTTTGFLYFATGPVPASGKALQPENFILLGSPIEVIANSEEKLSWRKQQTIYISGNTGEDENVGKTLYVVLDGKIAGGGVNYNNGAPNGQVAWDNLRLLCEE
ncbi:MAG: right-handed parallel beta-helix repeat-containing protein [Candidatus Omnitrophica bacterium]|nr:right-handed parallel beta-helix repeat-containing protein [Candidatus Omnitrophota bacterium]